MSLQCPAGGLWALGSGNGTNLDDQNSSATRKYTVAGVNSDTKLNETIAIDPGVVGSVSVTATCTAAPGASTKPTNTDSVMLRAMQVSAMPIIAQVSGQAITGAIFDAISVSFTGKPVPFTPNGSGFTYYFGADPQMQRSAADRESVNRFLASPDGSGRQVDDRFAALGYAGPTKAPPLAAAPTTVVPRDWLAWVDVRGTEFDRDATNDLNGTQVNAVGGVTRRLTPDLLVGVGPPGST